MTQGQGEGAYCFSSFDIQDLIDYTETHKGEGSFAIKYPDGSWHNWDKDKTK